MKETDGPSKDGRNETFLKVLSAGVRLRNNEFSILLGLANLQCVRIVVVKISLYLQFNPFRNEERIPESTR